VPAPFKGVAKESEDLHWGDPHARMTVEVTVLEILDKTDV
jgi:hypothetical protein